MVNVRSRDITITELPFNKDEKKNISSIIRSIEGHSSSAKYLMYMNFLNIALGVFYYSIIEGYQKLFISLHGIICFFILKEYYFHKCFVYHDFKKYLMIIQNFLIKKNINIKSGDYLSSWTIHGGISTAAERIMAKNQLDDALQNISNKKKWKYIFDISKIIKKFAGIPF